MMQKLNSLIITACIFFFISCNTQQLPLKEQLLSLDNVVEVNEVSLDTTFTEQYEVYFLQYIDHENPRLGTFKQRVIVSHQDFKKPVVAVLEGYKIWNGRQAELTKLMNSNQINIEHRFFKDSRPDSIPWEHLTIWQAATDQHLIIEALQEIYPENWLTTGISKGGQATMYHRAYYSADVQASVPYVAPLNFAREDNRIYEFLDNVGSMEERESVYQFQLQCFKNFDALLALLKEKAEEKGWTFNFGYKKALEYTILEYSFAFWQWGNYNADQIPGKGAATEELFNHLNKVAGFTFFEDKSVEENRPFFWAALTQIGMYGYNTAPFSEFLGDTVYTFDFTAPQGTNPEYEPGAMQDIREYLDFEAENMLFIVGGLDTWGATAYVPSENNNLETMVLDKGHHGTRIRHFAKKDREHIYSLLENWMDIEIEDIFAKEEKQHATTD